MLTHWKIFWCSEGLEEDNRGWDGWMASLIYWMWVWVNSGSWQRTGRPGVLWFMGSQSIRHDERWTELNWTEGRLKANLFQSWTSRVKKQSCRFITITLYWKGTATGERRPGLRAPMSSIVAFIALKSCNHLHFPDFLMTKMGVFQGLLEGSIWLAASCSISKSPAACSFSAGKDHCSTHPGSSDFQIIGLAARETASMINLNILNLLY